MIHSMHGYDKHHKKAICRDLDLSFKCHPMSKLETLSEMAHVIYDMMP